MTANTKLIFDVLLREYRKYETPLSSSHIGNCAFNANYPISSNGKFYTISPRYTKSGGYYLRKLQKLGLVKQCGSEYNHTWKPIYTNQK